MVLATCLSLLAGGASTQAQGVPGGGWSPAAGAMGDNTYQGFIDEPASGATLPAGASFTVSGWVVDTSAEGWSGIDGVQVQLGDTVLAQGTVGLSRPDVAATLGNPFYANSGFSAAVSTALPTGPQTLTVVAHTPNKGSWSKQVSVNVSGAATQTFVTGNETTGLVLRVISPKPNDVVPATTFATIYGVAYDTRVTHPELGVGVDRIQLYLDAPRGTAGSQNLGDAVQNGTNWSRDWSPTTFDSVAHHILWVYARSNVTGEEAILQQDLYIK
jgi:hypothetical protein